MSGRRRALAGSAVQQPGVRNSEPPDSGLRLLIARSGLLRWAPDPDAPAVRALVDGELRLGIRCFELTGSDLEHAGCRGWVRHAQSDGREWHSLPAVGIAEVLESQVPGVPVGAMVQGRLLVGTHLIVQVSDIDGAGFSAAEQGPSIGASRYSWPAAGGCTATVGPDAVEQAVEALRDQSHGTAATCLLSLAPHSSSGGPNRSICDSSCTRPWQRRPTPDSSIGHPAM